jgi:hypothetical protein
MARHLRKGRVAKKSRQESALIRQEVRNTRSTAEQINVIGDRGHIRCKETELLLTGKKK